MQQSRAVSLISCSCVKSYDTFIQKVCQHPFSVLSRFLDCHSRYDPGKSYSRGRGRGRDRERCRIWRPRFIKIIAAHVEAASGNGALVQEAGRRADAAHRLMKSLAGATFPDGHPSLARVVQILNELEARSRKWCKSSKWSQRLALTRSGTSKACKYRESFQQLFALLDRALQELMSAVQVDSYSNLTKLRADFQEEAVKLNQDFSTAAAAAGEHVVSQAEVLEALGDQGASLEVLLEASRAQANALVEMEIRLDGALGSLKADLAAGREAAQAAVTAAAAVAEAMQKHSSGDGGRSAEDNTDAIVAALKANILDQVVPELLDALVAEGKLTRAAVNEAKDAVVGEVRSLGSKMQESYSTLQETQNSILEQLKALNPNTGEVTKFVVLPAPVCFFFNCPLLFSCGA